MILESFAAGRWQRPEGESRPVFDAVTGDVVAEVARGGLDYAGMMRFAREEGGRNLRAMTFHERGRMIKALAVALGKGKEELYGLSHRTGATKEDAWVDVDGGIGTLYVYASKGRRELPDDHAVLDGAMERTSRNGTFVGHHIKVPRRGVAFHINAYNFPVWGML
ncbi:MAG: aldehyde dehydrogenase family protein, partial [Myxococcota bacterium]